MKNEIKQTVRDEQKYAKEREEKLAKAKEQLSKMSQEEKDNIVMNYLMNKQIIRIIGLHNYLQSLYLCIRKENYIEI